MAKKILKAIVFIPLLALSFFWVLWLLTPLPMNERGGKISDLPRNSVDLLFVGSSVIYRGIDPNDLWEQTGIASYVEATSAQSLQQSYYILENALQYQTPKLVLIDAYAFEQRNHNLTNKMPSVFGSLTITDDFSAKAGAASSHSKDWKETFDYMVPISIYHDRWKNLSETDVLSNRREYSTNRYLGTFYDGYSTPMDFPSPEMPYPYTDEMTLLAPDAIEYYHRIVALSKEKGFELAFIKNPEPRIYEMKQMQKRMNATSELLEKDGIPFFDMLGKVEEIPIDFSSDFDDEVHLNKQGAQKVTRYLAENFLNGYDLPDRRQSPGYDYWEETTQAYDHYSKVQLLQLETDLPAYMSLLAEIQDDIVICISARGDVGEDRLLPIYRSILGMEWPFADEPSYHSSYISIWDPSANLKYELAANEYLQAQQPAYDYPVNIRITSGGSGSGDGSSIKLDGVEYSLNKKGLNIVIYDKTSDNVIDSFYLETPKGEPLEIKR